MEGNSFEDMLFGCLSQGSLDAAETDSESGEEMLDDGFESEYGDAEFACGEDATPSWKKTDPDAEILEYDEEEFETEMPPVNDTEDSVVVKNRYAWALMFQTRTY